MNGLKPLQVVDKLRGGPVSFITLLTQYLRNAGSLFDPKLSTDPFELFYLIDPKMEHYRAEQNFNEKWFQKKLHDGFSNLSFTKKEYFHAKAEQNVNIRAAIGNELIFHSERFYVFCEKEIQGSQKGWKDLSLKRMTKYRALRKSFMETLEAPLKMEDFEIPRPSYYNESVFHIAVEEMLTHSKSLAKGSKAFQQSFLLERWRNDQKSLDTLKILPEEQNVIGEVHRIARKTSKIVGAIPEKKSVKGIFENYLVKVRKRGEKAHIDFKNVIHAHAFFENYVNYLNAIRYWKLQRVKKALIA